MQVAGLLTIFTALSLVVALQLGGIKNDTSTVKDNVSSTTETSVPTEDTSNSWFSIVGAIGSAATAAAFGVIIYQTSLTKKQIAQTQKELENTLRPWLGLLQTYGKDTGFSVDFRDIDKVGAKITAEYFLKNYGRVPARITSKRYKWSKKEISKNELYNEKIPDEWSSSRLQSMIFPDEDAKSSTYSEQSFLTSPDETFYFGLLVEYDQEKAQERESWGAYLGIRKTQTLMSQTYTNG